LNGFQSTNGFVANADNDVDFDNNGFGPAYSDIMSGIVTLTPDEEPLNDGDPEDCYFDYDGSGNNTVDFGFFNPSTTSVTMENGQTSFISVYPNPVSNQLTVKSSEPLQRIDLFDALGSLQQTFNPSGDVQTLDLSSLPAGIYSLRLTAAMHGRIETRRIVKD
jgi:hypothetical protein